MNSPQLYQMVIKLVTGQLLHVLPGCQTQEIKQIWHSLDISWPSEPSSSRIPFSHDSLPAETTRWPCIFLAWDVVGKRLSTAHSRAWPMVASPFSCWRLVSRAFSSELTVISCKLKLCFCSHSSLSYPKENSSTRQSYHCEPETRSGGNVKVIKHGAFTKAFTSLNSSLAIFLELSKRKATSMYANSQEDDFFL